MSPKRCLHSTIIVLFLITLLLTGAFPSSKKPVQASSTAPTAFANVDAYIEEEIQRLNLPGASLVVVEGEQIVHSQHFGNTATEQTPYFIGSLTKSITALAVMQLVENGQISLDAPVQTYLPWFNQINPELSTEITIRDLLHQTSGIPQMPGMLGLANFDSSTNAIENQVQIALNTLKSRPKPGTVWEYSNVNYNLLGLIIEAVSGETYENYIQNHIFDPLNMKHSFTSKATALQDDLAAGHQQWFGFPIPVPDLKVPTGSLPSGQLIASATDLGHYLIAHINGGVYKGQQILSSEGIKDTHQPAVKTHSIGMENESYGMGWFIRETPLGSMVWHYGEVPDSYAYMAMLPEQNTGLILLVNTNQHFYTYALNEVGDQAFAFLTDNTIKKNPWHLLPWILRSLVILPLIQLVVMVSKIKKRRSQNSAAVNQHSNKQILLRLLPGIVINLLLVAIPIGLTAGGIFKFSMLFMGDITLILTLSGTLSLFWIIFHVWVWTHPAKN